MGKAFVVPNVVFSTNLGQVSTDKFVFNHVELTSYNSISSIQGAAVYGNYLFKFTAANGNIIRIIDMSTGSTVQDVTVQAANTDRHCNSMCFSNLKYDESDTYPLLYVGGNQKSLLEFVDVYRVVESGGSFTITRAQTINSGFLGYVDIAWWNDKMVLKNSGYFNIITPPSISENNPILDSDDVVAKYPIQVTRTYTQGLLCHNNCVFILSFDTYTSKGMYDFILSVYDLNTGALLMNQEINYGNDYNIEFEQVVEWNGDIYLVGSAATYKTVFSIT